MKLNFESNNAVNGLGELTTYLLDIVQSSVSNDYQYHSIRKLILSAFAEYKKQFLEKSGKNSD